MRPTVDGGAPLVAVSLPYTGGRHFTAGQWVFLCVPRLGLLHWHPFTIASSGHDSAVELAIACKGPWTLRLAELAATEASAKVRCHHSRHTRASALTYAHSAQTHACSFTHAQAQPQPSGRRQACTVVVCVLMLTGSARAAA